MRRSATVSFLVVTLCFPISAWAAVFPPGPGDPSCPDQFPSDGVFKIVALDGTEIVVAGLNDPNTVVGRSDPHPEGDAADTGAMICDAGPGLGFPDMQQLVADSCRPPLGWNEADPSRREVHTEILSFNLTGNGVTIRAGQPYYDSVFPQGVPGPAARFFRFSTGEVTSDYDGDPAEFSLDFPADSFFDIYAEIDIPGQGLKLYNKTPMVVRAPITQFPPDFSLPDSSYIHDPSFGAVPLFDLRGVPFGWLLSAGHGSAAGGGFPPIADARLLLEWPATFSIDEDSRGLDPQVTAIVPNHAFDDRGQAAQQVTAYFSSGIAPGAPPDTTNARSIVGDLGGMLEFAAGDAINAFSFGRDGTVPAFPPSPTCTPGEGTLFFSVTRESRGEACSDVGLNGSFPLPEAAADLFVSAGAAFGLYTDRAVMPAPSNDNLLASDSTHLGLRPMLGDPAEDNVTGVELGEFEPNGMERDFLFATFTGPTYTGAEATVHVWNPDDGPFTAGNVQVYAVAADLGLQAGDVIDSLALSDAAPTMSCPPRPNGLLNVHLDEVLFSLAPGSPSLLGADGAPGLVGTDDDGINGVDDLGETGLGDDLSPADVFYSDFDGVFAPFLAHDDLGLMANDSLDATDIKPVRTSESCEIRFDLPPPNCNSLFTLTVLESDDPPHDPATGLDPAVISARTTVQVVDAQGTVFDQETGIVFNQPNPGLLEFQSDPLVMMVSGTPAPDNGFVEVEHGRTLLAIYHETTALGNFDKTDSMPIDCQPRVTIGETKIPQLGQDEPALIENGCETDVFGNFDHGFPDRYMDAGETVKYTIAFDNSGPQHLQNPEVELRCVLPDADSPGGCSPQSQDCPDPQRENNSACPWVSVLDPVKKIGIVPSGAPAAASFLIEVANSVPAVTAVEMLLSVADAITGKTTPAVLVNPQTLDVDETSFFYSTDYPLGGTEIRDLNNNEIVEDPIVAPLGLLDYEFETTVYSDLTAGGTKNTTLQSPWNFDLNDGGFRSGLAGSTTAASISDIIAQWGEDTNFNGVLDGWCLLDGDIPCVRTNDPFCFTETGDPTCVSFEDRDPVNGILDQNRSTLGGCGWVTKAAGQQTGGVWHTGRIGSTTEPSCLVTGNNPGQCQGYETISGFTSNEERTWFELLMMPTLEKVNDEPESKIDIDIVHIAWNQAIDLPDSNIFWTWEFDTDFSDLEPIDLRDLTLLNLGAGGYGAVTQKGDPELSNGFSMFALLDEVGNSTNGTQGQNREAKNSCFFEGGAVASETLKFLGLPGPPDDDEDNDLDTLIDEFVLPNGPIRNFSTELLKKWLPLEFDLLSLLNSSLLDDPTSGQDLFEPFGDFFRGAFGFGVNQKDSPADPEPQRGFGVVLDDVVFRWKEFRLDPDQSDCNTGGRCAELKIEREDIFNFEGVRFATLEEIFANANDGLLTIKGIEASPPVDNDCDGDGNPNSNTDCNSNGIRDIVVRVVSAATPLGELVYLDLVDSAIDLFQGSIAVSTKRDVPGTLFVRPDGTLGSVLQVLYDDTDDGTGQPCRNGNNGIVRELARIALRVGKLIVQSVRLEDNGDLDGFADTNETVSLFVTVANKTGMDLTNVIARINTVSPHVDCLLSSEIAMGDLTAGETRESVDPFVLRVADIDRTGLGLGPLEDLSAALDITFSSNEIQAAERAQQVVLDLDLDVIGGGSVTSFLEDFETGTLGLLSGMNLDLGLHDSAASDGHRCRYSDPALPGNNVRGAECLLGANPIQAASFHWQIAGPVSIDGGRAFTGTHSLYFGVFGPVPGENTTPLGTLEAVQTTDPINLDYVGIPELSIKHQISLADERFTPLPHGETLDRGVVQVQLADDLGNPLGDWQTIQPYKNPYDAQGTGAARRCMFDPVDDGTTEDDRFNDWDNRLGPSSTCYTEHVFGHQGDASSAAFNPSVLGRASDGPGQQGSSGAGTWVESRFSLERYRGKRIRMRFLASTTKIADFETYAAAGTPSDATFDDGWYIDTVTLTNTLSSPATLLADTKPNITLPACGLPCSFLVADLVADPPALPAPGHSVLLSAAGSFADRCVDGTLQYQIWIDGDANGLPGDPADTLLRDWSDNPLLRTVASISTQFGVAVRCSSDPVACSDAAATFVTVDGPLGGGPGESTQLLATGFDSTTGQIQLSFSPACGTSDHNIEFGPLQDVSIYGYGGQECSIGSSGTFNTFNPGPGDFFLLVVGNDGSGTEGSYGKDGDGIERPEDLLDPACFAAQDLSQRCD